MRLKIKLKVEFDDDKGTVSEREVWVTDFPSIDPTHAIVKAVITDAKV